jgi:hypothetical protein
MPTLNLGNIRGPQGPAGADGANGISEAPIDGEKYVRLDGAWVHLTTPPLRNQLYDSGGAVLLEEPSDIIPDFWAMNRFDGVAATLTPTTTTIGGGAFFLSGITSIVIPDSVTVMGSQAFFVCQSLTSATIGNGLSVIPSEAFSGCTSLASVTLGSNVTIIGWGAFRSTALTSVTLPASVTDIEDAAFYSSYALSSVSCLAMTAPSVGTQAFDSIAATEIHVPAGASGYGSTFGGLTVIYDL